jgi:hypothetical protein
VEKQRRWNFLSMLSVLIAIILALVAISRIDTIPIESRDALRLSSSSRALSVDPSQLPPSGWTTLRGDLLNSSEAQVDRKALDEAEYFVQIGVYANTTSELDLSIPSYASGGYIWMIWNESLQRYLNDEGVSINERFSLLNRLDSSGTPDLTLVGDGTKRLENGDYYQLFDYQGRFLIDQASFRRYPFMSISLPIFIEPDDNDGSLNYRNLRLDPDIRNSGMGFNAKILGWLNQGWSIAEYRHQYATNFGQGGDESDYSVVLFDISFGTSSWASVWRLFLPLAVLMSMVLLVFKVRPDEQDARASIPVTVLLTLVFLQQSYRSDLPVLPFLTFLDQVYVVAYIVTLIAFILVLWIGRRYADIQVMNDSPERSLLLRRLYLLDETWPLVVLFLGGSSIAICWIAIPQAARFSIG